MNDRDHLTERVNKHAAKYIGLRIKLDEAEKKIAELQASADLRWKADMRAIERWHAAHPDKELVWPGCADLCVWLMGELDEVNARIATAPIGRLTSKSGAGPCNIVEMDGAAVFGANAYGAKVRIVPYVTG